MFSPRPQDFEAHPNPAGSYAEALERIQAIRQAEPATVNQKCQYQALVHPGRTPMAIVFFHGYTNCPQQFAALGQQLFDAGYNVLLPRLPHHGLVDRLTSDQAQLTASEVMTAADQAIDIAQGLGQRVVVVGISAGAVEVAWAVQNRRDLAAGVLIAPSLGYAGMPKALAQTFTLLCLRLPNLFIWWNRSLKEHIPGPTHSYPRFATRAIGQIFWLGRAVLAAAQQAAPYTTQLTMVTSEADLAVNKALIAELFRRWQAHGVANLHSYTFPAALGIVHDMIDPDQTRQRIDVVYPLLIDMITRDDRVHSADSPPHTGQ